MFIKTRYQKNRIFERIQSKFLIYQWNQLILEHKIKKIEQHYKKNRVHYKDSFNIININGLEFL